nr:EOG090X0EI4 [Eurycercus lamellatus]
MTVTKCTLIPRQFRAKDSKLLSGQSPLATLRKNTGYSISNCKKALEANGNNLEQAEAWLNSQAQAQGWDKAAKLQNRATKNGLVGIAFNNKNAVIVEVNCETDFVARNEKFKNLVAKAAETCFVGLPSSCSTGSTIVQQKFSSEQLGALNINGDSKTLSDVVALNIGQIGENISVRQGASLSSSSDNIKIACYSHPLEWIGEILLGKYGAVVAYVDNSKSSLEPSELPDGVCIEKLPKQLCQHIIGMNPRSIDRIEGSAPGDGETALVHQEFVANPEYLVGEVLEKVGWEIKGFVRIECGESSQS